VLRDHRGGALTVAFRPDGQQVATGSADGVVRLWNSRTGELEAILPSAPLEDLPVFSIAQAQQSGGISSSATLDGRLVLDVAFSPSGDWLAAATHNLAGGGAVDLYVVTPAKLLEVTRPRLERELTCEERVQYLYEARECS
jgi:WD40 repeat protein